MISFVWYFPHPFKAGAGGSENFTAGVARELLHRGKKVQIVTVGFGENDGRADFPDIPFLALDDPHDIATLPQPKVFVIDPPPSQTNYPAHFMLQCPVWMNPTQSKDYALAAEGRSLIANSQYAAREWEKFLGRAHGSIPVVYPFADAAFNKVERKKRSDGKIRVIFPSRLHPDKGIYPFLAAIHSPLLHEDPRFEFAVTTAGAHTSHGKIIKELVQAHPQIRVIEARKSPQAMAELLAEFDVAVVPSSAHYWHEPFGMISVEAQQAGCRVVASNDGGLPETDCGHLLLAEPDNPAAIATQIVEAAKKGPLTASERAQTAHRFTVQQTVDDLLQIIDS